MTEGIWNPISAALLVLLVVLFWLLSSGCVPLAGALVGLPLLAGGVVVAVLAGVLVGLPFLVRGI